MCAHTRASVSAEGVVEGGFKVVRSSWGDSRGLRGYLPPPDQHLQQSAVQGPARSHALTWCFSLQSKIKNTPKRGCDLFYKYMSYAVLLIEPKTRCS